ncbi:hypothetical protein EB822_07260 [Flavobacteriaceae bacterium PRS1]|nr:hypothetical protein EB822_07260 [Flavobacteriaceae bacterium PRS1]
MMLNYKIIIHFLGLLLVCNGSFMLVASLVSLIYKDGVTFQLFLSGITVIVLGISAIIFTRSHKKIVF